MEIGKISTKVRNPDVKYKRTEHMAEIKIKMIPKRSPTLKVTKQFTLSTISYYARMKSGIGFPGASDTIPKIEARGKVTTGNNLLVNWWRVFILI